MDTQVKDHTTTKPYLLRALYEWCVDNGLTPYVSVIVDRHTRVPMEYVRDGEIVLNIGPQAASSLVIGNDLIECTARFSGAVREVSVPVSAVSAIYSRENGQGMSFEVMPTSEETTEDRSSSEDASQTIETSGAPIRPTPGGRPNLRRVK